MKGYPEFNYWLECYSGGIPTPEINEDCPGAMNAQNYDYFKDVTMYRVVPDAPTSETFSRSRLHDAAYGYSIPPTDQMEHLFTQVNPIDGVGDPPRDSLFNLTSLKSLVTLGQ